VARLDMIRSEMGQVLPLTAIYARHRAALGIGYQSFCKLIARYAGDAKLSIDIHAMDGMTERMLRKDAQRRYVLCALSRYLVQDGIADAVGESTRAGLLMDADQLVAEIARQTRVRLNTADPILAAAVINELLLDRALAKLDRQVQVQADRVTAASGGSRCQEGS
jgi:hypothetical protein